MTVEDLISSTSNTVMMRSVKDMMKSEHAQKSIKNMNDGLLSKRKIPKNYYYNYRVSLLREAMEKERKE